MNKINVRVVYIASEVSIGRVICMNWLKCGLREELLKSQSISLYTHYISYRYRLHATRKRKIHILYLNQRKKRTIKV